jgi:hypothetical protein
LSDDDDDDDNNNNSNNNNPNYDREDAAADDAAVRLSNSKRRASTGKLFRSSTNRSDNAGLRRSSKKGSRSKKARRPSFDDLSMRRSSATMLPQKFVKYVLVSHNNVAFDHNDVTLSAAADDPYFKRNSIKAAICVPLKASSNLIGVLYAESAHIGGLFDSSITSVVSFVFFSSSSRSIALFILASLQLLIIVALHFNHRRLLCWLELLLLRYRTRSHMPVFKHIMKEVFDSCRKQV